MMNIIKTLTEDIMCTLESFFQYEYEEVFEQDEDVVSTGITDILNKE